MGSQSPHFGVQTFLPQQEGVEGHVVDAEVEEALSRHPALPAAAGVVRHQFLWRWEPKVQLELQQRLPELFRVLLLGGLATPNLLCNEALQRRELTVITSEHFASRKAWEWRFSSFLKSTCKSLWTHLKSSSIHALAHFTPWLSLWQSWRHPPCSQTRTKSEADCGPASPSACSPPPRQLLTHKKTRPPEGI